MPSQASHQRLEILANSPLMRVISHFVTVVVLPIVGWSLTTLLTEVRQLNDAIAKNNTVVALYDLRISSLEHAGKEWEMQLKALNDKQIEHELRISAIERGLK